MPEQDGSLPTQFIKDFSRGQINNVNRNVQPPNCADLIYNMDADEEIGSLVSRLGTALIGSQMVAAKTVLGLYNFRDTVGSNHKLLGTVNASGDATSVVYDVIGHSTIVTGLTASKKMRFKTYLDSVVMVNGTDGPRSYDGSSVITTGGAFDLGNWPAASCNLLEVFLSRVYTAGDTANPDRLYYSSIPIAGAISWTLGNGYIDIESSNGGGGIVALNKVPGYLIIFKERSMHRWNYNSAFPEELVDIGAVNQESVVRAAGLVAFFSASSKESRGFYVTNGGRPQPISHDRTSNIKKWIDAIPKANEANIAGIGTERFFAWEIGDVTVDGVAYTNVVLRWNRQLDQWTVRSYPKRFSVFATYVDASSGVNKVLGGDTDGNAIELDAAGIYVDYSAQPIFWGYQSQKEHFGYHQIKEVSERIVVESENAADAEVSIASNIKDQKQVNGRLGPETVSDIPIKKALRANKFQIGIKGTVQGARATLRGIEIPNIKTLNAYTSKSTNT